MLVGFDLGKERSLLDLAVDSARNKDIATIGLEATRLVEAELARRGYKVYRNAARANAMGFTQKVGGSYIWNHPESAPIFPEWLMGLSGAINRDRIIQGSLRGTHDDGNDYLVFSSASVIDGNEWSACVVWSRSPRVLVRTLVFDRGSNLVMDIKTWGRGDPSLYVADRSLPNMQKALRDAFSKLDSVEIEEQRF